MEWLEDLVAKVNPNPPIVLCFHPFDIGQKFHIPFVDMGYKIVTAGNSQSPKFADIFFQIIFQYNTINVY